MASSWDQRRLLGGSDVWAGAGRTRRIWVGRDGREEDFMGKVSREKMMSSGQGKGFGWNTKGLPRQLGCRVTHGVKPRGAGRTERCGLSCHRLGSQGPRRQTQLRSLGQCSFHSRLEKTERSGCGGGGKALEIFEQRYGVVWTTWAF